MLYFALFLQAPWLYSFSGVTSFHKSSQKSQKFPRSYRGSDQPTTSVCPTTASLDTAKSLTHLVAGLGNGLQMLIRGPSAINRSVLLRYDPIHMIHAAPFKRIQNHPQYLFNMDDYTLPHRCAFPSGALWINQEQTANRIVWTPCWRVVWSWYSATLITTPKHLRPVRTLTGRNSGGVLLCLALACWNASGPDGFERASMKPDVGNSATHCAVELTSM